jgi:hypothetical protein
MSAIGDRSPTVEATSHNARQPQLPALTAGNTVREIAAPVVHYPRLRPVKAAHIVMFGAAVAFWVIVGVRSLPWPWAEIAVFLDWRSQRGFASDGRVSWFRPRVADRGFILRP